MSIDVFEHKKNNSIYMYCRYIISIKCNAVWIVHYFCLLLHKESYMTESPVLSVRIHHWKESAGSAPTVAELICVACVTWATSMMWTMDSSVSILPPPQCKISSVPILYVASIWVVFCNSSWQYTYSDWSYTFFGPLQIKTIDEKVPNTDIFPARFFFHTVVCQFLIKINPV